MSNQCFIRIYKDRILARWETLSKETLPPTYEHSRAVIRDHLPQLIDALCEVIETDVFEKPKELSKIHGRQRYNFGDYTLSQVMEEYWLLKKVIFAMLNEIDKVSAKEADIISRFFEYAATSAAVEFTNLRERELKNTAKHLLSTNLDLERFAGVAAHDLRSPASTIVGYAELALEEFNDDDADTEYKLKTIKSIGFRMISLIDQLLEYTKIGKTEALQRKFSLSNAAAEAKANLEKNISEAGANVKIGQLPEIIGDPILFSQLFQNLIANALKFKSDKRPCQITITGGIENNMIKIKVKDNGIGFAPELNQEIFEPFKRGHTNQNIKGSGLGLATVQKIVDLHGGIVSASGTIDGGAEFNIEFPINVLPSS